MQLMHEWRHDDDDDDDDHDHNNKKTNTDVRASRLKDNGSRRQQQQQCDRIELCHRPKLSHRVSFDDDDDTIKVSLVAGSADVTSIAADIAPSLPLSTTMVIDYNDDDDDDDIGKNFLHETDDDSSGWTKGISLPNEEELSLSSEASTTSSSLSQIIEERMSRQRPQLHHNLRRRPVSVHVELTCC